MDLAEAHADRTALLPLRLLAALHALLFLVFLAGLAAAGARLHAEASAPPPPADISRPV